MSTAIRMEIMVTLMYTMIQQERQRKDTCTVVFKRPKRRLQMRVKPLLLGISAPVLSLEHTLVWMKFRFIQRHSDTRLYKQAVLRTLMMHPVKKRTWKAKLATTIPPPHQQRATR